VLTFPTVASKEKSVLLPIHFLRILLHSVAPLLLFVELYLDGIVELMAKDASDAMMTSIL